MKLSLHNVECSNVKFTTVEYCFSYSTDKALIDSLVQDGLKLATQVNPTLARDASYSRSPKTVKSNCVGGIIAEYCWRHWLTSEAARQKIDVIFASKAFQSMDKHVDISTTYQNNGEKTLEIRSSFPYTGLDNAVCRVFDIIGWYVNPVKTKEIRKDYYARTLFPFHVDNLYKQVYSNDFRVYLTGGATRSFLEKSQHARDKEFTPYDEIEIDRFYGGKALYRVIEPIKNSFDTIGITDIILKGLG